MSVNLLRRTKNSWRPRSLFGSLTSLRKPRNQQLEKKNCSFFLFVFKNLIILKTYPSVFFFSNWKFNAPDEMMKNSGEFVWENTFLCEPFRDSPLSDSSVILDPVDSADYLDPIFLHNVIAYKCPIYHS